MALIQFNPTKTLNYHLTNERISANRLLRRTTTIDTEGIHLLISNPLTVSLYHKFSQVSFPYVRLKGNDSREDGGLTVVNNFKPFKRITFI